MGLPVPKMTPQMPPVRNPTGILRASCANCGAPWEPRCSYCGTRAAPEAEGEFLDVTCLGDSARRLVRADGGQGGNEMGGYVGPQQVAAVLHRGEAVLPKDKVELLRGWQREGGIARPYRPPQPSEPDSHDWAPWKLALTAAVLALFLASQVAHYLGAL